MDKILAPIKQRILQIIDYKEVNKALFFRKLEIAASNFRSNSLYSEAGGDVIAKISSEFPDVNLEWLINGKGKMFKDSTQLIAEEPEITYSAGFKNDLYERLILEKEERIQEKDDRIRELNKNLEELRKQLTTQDKRNVSSAKIAGHKS